MRPQMSVACSIWGKRITDALATHSLASIRPVIYCVVPEPLADELYDRLSDYYDDDPNVEVIVDRRKKERRDVSSGGGGQREVRDRRRSRVPGEFPPLSAA
jgi:hypothetical protein